MYKYHSPIGVFTIKRSSPSKFALCFASDVLGHYESAVLAADEVYTHTTGLYEWDKLDGEINNVPTDIYEWDRV